MRQVININEKWAFTKDTDEIPKEMPKRWCWVHLPHTWNNIDGQDGNNDYYRGTGYYAKMIKRAELPKEINIFWKFGEQILLPIYMWTEENWRIMTEDILHGV